MQSIIYHCAVELDLSQRDPCLVQFSVFKLGTYRKTHIFCIYIKGNVHICIFMQCSFADYLCLDCKGLILGGDILTTGKHSDCYHTWGNESAPY